MIGLMPLRGGGIGTIIGDQYNMKERPILFNAPMVSAILAGTKAQTRRVVKPQPADLWPDGVTCQSDMLGPIRIRPADVRVRLGDNGLSYDAACEFAGPIACPYGQTGDRLWVRETHAPQADCWGAWHNWSTGEKNGPKPIIHYAADGGDPFIEKWRPSIHMPRWASRILLEIVSVRVERLQEISEADAKAEGARFGYGEPFAPENTITDRRRFELLWESLNGPGSWDINPFVWVVEFKRVTP